MDADLFLKFKKKLLREMLSLANERFSISGNFSVLFPEK
ncbi:protein of unknown function (plasmid) [Azospirillum baldaniorum]|uniref:Uncharacterized protein n=1 Tax=Azospirillum baldaniorum TaxID=1064539 RepID=A0A9P1NSF7_9PROT|nr:protein of unknown function [Azospirillum baldaniorum]